MAGDVVVIGGGLGGLSAGVQLAQAGHRVTLIEKEPRLGGYAVSFRRDDFTFDTALHVVPGGGPGEPFHRLLESLGVVPEVRFRRLSNGFLVRIGEDSYPLPRDYEAVFDALSSWFPDERRGLARLREHLAEHVPVYADLLADDISRWRTVPRFIPKLPSFLAQASLSAGDYLRQFVRDPKLLAVLYQPAMFFGVPTDALPAVNFMMMFYLLLERGPCTVEGGGQAVTTALERRLRSLGATIVTRSAVTRVRIEGGRAVAAVIADGREIRASAIVANVSLPVLVDRLVGREHFPDAYLRNLDRLEPSLSVLQIQIGLETSVREAGVDRYMTLVFPDPDLDGCLRRQSGSTGLEGFSITAPGVDDPDTRGRRDRTLSLLGGTSPRRWLELDEEGYRREKDRTEAAALTRLEKVFPGILRRIRVTDVATPRTFEQYTGNPGGAILGFRCTCGSHRQLFSVARVPIRNLHVAGAWTEQLGGFMPSIRAGVRAARRAIEG